ncbi:hypothetical protein [Paenibacillus sp. BJ-4]|uniref:hypothetical protein n=1 Tax=Paenibacillus sp. BJ-4 TaxID=2878097 RepID=UPI001CEFF9F9|nr:hypothetical protein [Paenibacillus sp. BJ-4]
MTFEEAAVVPVGAYTALQFLRKGNIQRGSRALIYGSSAAWGHMLFSSPIILARK